MKLLNLEKVDFIILTKNWTRYTSLFYQLNLIMCERVGENNCSDAHLNVLKYLQT